MIRDRVSGFPFDFLWYMICREFPFACIPLHTRRIVIDPPDRFEAVIVKAATYPTILALLARLPFSAIVFEHIKVKRCGCTWRADHTLPNQIDRVS